MSGYASVVAFAALLLASWQIARRSGQPGQLAGAMRAPAAALAASQPIAAHVAEARPYASMSGLLVLAHRSTEFSFPSDHATMAGAAAAGLFLVNRRLGLIAAAAALLLAFARLYTAAHYPDGVTAGLILGMTVTLAGYALLEDPLTRLLAGYLLQTRLQPSLTADGGGRARQTATPPAVTPAGTGQVGR